MLEEACSGPFMYSTLLSFQWYAASIVHLSPLFSSYDLRISLAVKGDSNRRCEDESTTCLDRRPLGSLCIDTMINWRW